MKKGIAISKDRKRICIGTFEESILKGSFLFVGFYYSKEYIRTLTSSPISKDRYDIYFLPDESYEKLNKYLEELMSKTFDEIFSNFITHAKVKIPVSKTEVNVLCTNDINTIIKSVYGVDIHSEEDWTCSANEIFSIDSTVLQSTEKRFLDGTSTNGCVLNTLCMLCRDGYLDEGQYIISKG